jgi:hypothetical protein
LARNAGLKPENGQHMVVTFDNSGKVIDIQGADSFPAEQPGLPESQDPGLSNKLINFESAVPRKQA